MDQYLSMDVQAEDSIERRRDLFLKTSEDHTTHTKTIVLETEMILHMKENPPIIIKNLKDEDIVENALTVENVLAVENAETVEAAEKEEIAEREDILEKVSLEKEGIMLGIAVIPKKEEIKDTTVILILVEGVFQEKEMSLIEDKDHHQ